MSSEKINLKDPNGPYDDFQNLKEINKNSNDQEVLSNIDDQSNYQLMDEDQLLEQIPKPKKTYKVYKREIVEKKMTEEDQEIELCFKGGEKVSPLIYLEVKTSAQTSFKLSDDAIVCIDDDISLKLISTVDQQLDKNSYESYSKIEFNAYLAKLILLEKKLSDVISDYDKENMAVTNLISSFDKREIIMCTKHGQVKILNPENFDELQNFDNLDESAIIDISIKNNFFAVAHKNGKIFIYKKADEKSPYALVEIKRENQKKLCMPVQFDQEILAIKFSTESDHLIVILESLTEEKQEKQLFLYNQKFLLLNAENKPEKLVAKEQDALSLKRFVDFASECFIMRTQNQKGFKTISYEKFEKICETVKITSVPCNLLTFLPDKKTVLLLDEKETFLYTVEGLQIESILPDDKNSCFLIAPFQIDTTDYFQLVSLPDQTTLFTFKENIFNQPVIFQKDENCNLFAGEGKAFFIEMQDNKPNFKNVQFVTQDQKIIVVCDPGQDGGLVTELYEVKTHRLLKKLPNIKVLTCDFQSQYLYCSHTENESQKTVRISIKQNKKTKKISFESEIICDRAFDEIQVTKDNQFIYCKAQNNLYKISVLEKKEVQVLLILQNFSFQISNNEQWIMLATAEMLMKISIQDNYMVRRDKIQVYEGLKDQISFDPQDLYFTIGGSESQDINVYGLDTLEKVNTIESHKSKNNACYFIGKNRALTISNGESLMVCWDITEMGNWKLIFSQEKYINALTGFNKILTAINMNQQTYVWNEILAHELTDDVQALNSKDVKLEWISGPLNKLFWLISDHYEKSTQNQKGQLLPHLMKNVIHPYGYTYFSWLAYNDKTDIMKNVIEYNDVKYIRDFEGNAPLLYALKRNSAEKVSWILDFISNQTKVTKSSKLFKQISNAELILLLRLGPVALVPFFESAIIPIDDNLCINAKKIDEDNPSYMMTNPLTARFKTAEQVLCEQDVDETEKLKVEFVQGVLPLNFRVGSWESVDFQEALDDCPNDKVFNTEYMKAVITYKARLVTPLVYFLLAMQVFFTFTVTVHAYLPGKRVMIFVILGFIVYLTILELIIWYQNDFTFKFNHAMNILIILMVIVYSVVILHEVNELVDTMLPFINLLCWLQMIMQLKQFQIIRAFVKIFIATIEALSGFIAFLLVMLLAFSTTYSVIVKRNQKIKKMGGKYSGLYDEQFYIKNELNKNLEDDIYEISMAVYDTYVTMITGNYNEDDTLNQTFIYIIFVVLVILIANVILLNIIVAIMSDSYVEVMTSMDEKSFQEQSNSILKHEKIMFWKRYQGKKSCLVWMNYLDVVDNTWKSQVEAITSAVKNTFKNVLVEFEKTEVKLLGVLADQIDKSDVSLNDKLDKNAAKVSNYMDKQSQNLATINLTLNTKIDQHQQGKKEKIEEEMRKEKEELQKTRNNFDQKIINNENHINDMKTNLSEEMNKVKEDVKGTLTQKLEDQTNKLSDLSTNLDQKLTNQEKDLVGMKSELSSQLDQAQNDIKTNFSQGSENQENQLKNIQSELDLKLDSQIAQQEGIKKELDSKISKTSEDAQEAQNIGKKLAEEIIVDNSQIKQQLSKDTEKKISVGSTLVDETDKAKVDTKLLSSRDFEAKVIGGVQNQLAQEIIAQKESIKKSVLDKAQSQMSTVQKNLTSQIDKQQADLKDVKEYLAQEIVKQQAQTKDHLTSKMESQLKNLKASMAEQIEKKEHELNDMKLELSNMITDQNVNLSAQMSEITSQVNGLKNSQTEITEQLDELFNVLSTLSK